MSYFEMLAPKQEKGNIMLVSENAALGSQLLSQSIKDFLNNYTQSDKAKSAGTTPPKNTAKKKDSFLEGFNDPYGEKNAFPRQSLAQRMMAQFTNPVQQTPQSPMIKTETPKYALPNIGNSKNNYSEKKVEAPKTELRASPSANTSEDDAFREGFNYYNDKELMFPNTELHAKPKNYGVMFPNTELHAGSSENKSEDDAFLDGFNDPYGEKEKEEKSKWQKVLDGISTGLTAASFIPGLDTVTNLAQIPVDLLRGDFLGAGLDLVGIIPFIGEAADVAKTARTADRIIDGVRAADKVTDGIKAADGIADGAKAVNQSVDILKSTDGILDTAKTSDAVVKTTRTGKNAGEFAKPYPKESVPSEINDCLSKLLNDGDKIQVSRTPDLDEISLMSRQEAVEFASVTIGNRNYVLRGNATGTTISQDILEDMVKNKGVLNCHSHPYIGDYRPSPSDLYLAEILKHQEEFRIVTPDGMQAIYTKEGIKSVGNIGNKLSEEDILELYKLFGG